LSRGPGYNVNVAGRHDGSLEGAWIVEFLAKEALKAGFSYVAKKALTYTYEQLLKDSIAPILARKQSSMPLELQREAVFEPLDGSNEPFVNLDRERAFIGSNYGSVPLVFSSIRRGRLDAVQIS